MPDRSNHRSESLLVDHDDAIATITLNRPTRLNALDKQLMDLLVRTLEDVAEDAAVRSVIVTGAGRSFCAGGDLTMAAERRSAMSSDAPLGPILDEQLSGLERHSRIAELLATMPKPTVCALRGHAVGGGLAIALGCDFRIGSTNAILRGGYASAGLSGDLGISTLLVDLVGIGKARELMILDEPINATDAQRLGLLTDVVDQEALLPTARELATRLAAGPTMAFGKIKQNLWKAASRNFSANARLEAVNVRITALSHDAAEAGRARSAHENPSFEGR